VSGPNHSLTLPERLRLPPLWTLVVAFIAAAAVVAWQLANGGSHPTVAAFHLLLWPGAVVFLAVYLFAWLGWALDID
jgi:hypothetical protein